MSSLAYPSTYGSQSGFGLLHAKSADKYL